MNIVRYVIITGKGTEIISGRSIKIKKATESRSKGLILSDTTENIRAGDNE